MGALTLVVLASCFHGAKPSATLAPAMSDGPSRRTQGPFSVVYAAPRGHVADRKQPGVTVLFSRAVRAVEMNDDEKLPAITIKTKAGANVAGAWRWTGTRGLLFTPEGELPGGSDFVVTVPPDVKALDGSVLGKPFTLDLDTNGPSVVSTKVVGPPGVTDQALPANAALQIEFDQSVEPSAVAAASSLRIFKADGDRGETIRLVASRPSPLPVPTAPSTPPAYVVVLKPEKPLPLDHQIELSITGLRGTGGPRPMGEPVTRSLRTHGPLRFVDFYCPRITTKGRCRANGDVKVVLSNPVRPEELKSHVGLAKLPVRPPPKPGAKAPPRRIDPSTEHWLSVAPKLGEQYKVTLLAGMRDIYGQKLERDATFDIQVEAPLVKPPSSEGAAAAPAESKKPTKKPPHKGQADDESRPRRERLPYQLDLGLVGHVLEAGRGHKIPVGTVNIPTYSTLAAGLSDTQATSWILAHDNPSDFVARNGLRPTWRTTAADVNERAVDFIDLDAVLAPRKGRGPALVVVASPGSPRGGDGTKSELVMVTDLGVTAKMSPFGGLIWVTRLSSGKPVGGASVAIRTVKQGEVFQATTDSEGLVVVPIERFDPLSKEAKNDEHDDSDESREALIRTDSAIVVKSGDDWTITKIAPSSVERRLASDFQLLSKEARWAGMLFADRGVFRPGETAKIAGIVRVVEGGGLRTIPGRELRIQLKDQNSEQIFDGRAKSDDFGTFSLDVKIPKTATIGTATVIATAPPGGTSNTSVAGDFRHEIRILEFKPNEFKVTAEPDKPWYVRGDSAVFTTRGDYLFGAPMQNASVTSTVSRQEVPFIPKGAEAFSTTDEVFTGDYADDTKAAENVDSQDGVLDDKGSFKRSVALAFDDQRRPERIVFDAEVQDLSRNTVSARSSALLHPGEFYVGLRTPKDRFVAAGTALRTEVVAVEPNGTRRAHVKVKVDLVERRWNGVVGEQPDGRATRATKPTDAVVSTCEAQTSGGPSGCDLRVPRAGYFIVRATATDPRGNTVRASMSVYGTEDAPRTETAWAIDDRHEIKVEANKKSYEIGESARIVLRNPFKEAEALVTVERNGVLWRQVVAIKGAVPVVEIPIRPEFYPNAFVSVVALRGRVKAAPATGADLGGPEYRFGWAELHVNEEAHRLSVAVTSAKAEYQPGAMVDAEVVVKDRAGKPVESALTFYVVDEGVLALTSYVTPDPLPSFVKRRKLRVFTFDNREDLARIVAMQAGERLSPLGYEYALGKNVGDAYDKGDDGGDGGLRRAEFRTTAFFEAGRKTDKSGRAHFSFKLPDNLTTFRVMAVAAGSGDDFGSGESKITTYRRLMARPALPRVLRVGDALEASVIVSSKAPGPRAESMSVDVRLDVKGLTLTGAPTRRVTMPRGGQTEVRFPVKAVTRGDAELTFEVRSGADADKVVMKRRVDLPLSVESAVLYGETSTDTAVALGDLSAIRKDYGGLEVRLSSSALVGLGMAVDRLTDYPYGCTEQLTSRLLPMLAMRDLSKNLNARLPHDVNAAVDTAVEGILKRQKSDGGFGFWDKSPSEPWLSAYAMLAISAAAEQKHFVPKDVLEQGRSYLNFSLANATRRLAQVDSDKSATEKDKTPDSHVKSETAKAIDYAGAALIGDTLAALGAPNPGALNVLYDARSGQRLFAQAALLHAMAKSDMGAKQLKAFSSEIESRLRVGPNAIDVDEGDDDRYGAMLESRARTLAMVLRALLAVNPKHVYAARIARQLLALRQPEGSWRSTQEDGWALLALADYRRLQESGAAAFDAQASLGGSELLSVKFAKDSLREDTIFVPASTLATRGGTLSFDLSGGGPLYYSAALKYATTTLPTRGRDEGLFVTKYMRSVAPAAVADAQKSIPKRTTATVAPGDLVLVDLLFESAEPRQHVVLDDPLPAGLEALDYDLDTTSKAARDASNKANGSKTTWLGTTFRTATSHREVRDDRVVTYFDAIEPGMYRVTYLARATSAGTFVLPPTRIEAMYSPEVYGRTPATTLVVRAAETVSRR